mgnify:CR=1 FL=1
MNEGRSVKPRQVVVRRHDVQPRVQGVVVLEHGGHELILLKSQFEPHVPFHLPQLPLKLQFIDLLLPVEQNLPRGLALGIWVRNRFTLVLVVRVASPVCVVFVGLWLFVA